jgi:hypothetical protein
VSVAVAKKKRKHFLFLVSKSERSRCRDSSTVVLRALEVTLKMESKGDIKKKEVLKQWNELLNAQPQALIKSKRIPMPLSPYICFCLSEQQSIKEELHRENPGLSVSVFFYFHIKSVALHQ